MNQSFDVPILDTLYWKWRTYLYCWHLEVLQLSALSSGKLESSNRSRLQISS